MSDAPARVSFNEGGGRTEHIAIFVLLALAGCVTPPRGTPLPEDSPEAGEILLHAGPLGEGQVVRAAIVSQSFPVAMAAAEVNGPVAGTAESLAYDAYSGSGERVLVVSGDLGNGPVILDKTPLMLSSAHVLAEVWVRVRPNGFVDVSWQLLTGEPNVKVTAQGVANKSDRAFTSVRRSAVFPGNGVRACPFELEVPAQSTAPLNVQSFCAVRGGNARVPLVMTRPDGSQVLVVAELPMEPTDAPLLESARIAELETRLGADGALALIAPDGQRACACEGSVFGRERVKLVRADRDCVLVQYPDHSQRCLEAAAE